ncbi:MAG: NAD(P)H-binding protein, partial [Chloroflexi bacterium]|nr:NAD(P)H-binding protein [Chloroflexota bacterium]
MSMPTPELHVVTGAFGFTGRYIARKLLAEGKRVRTLLSHPNRPDPFDGQVEAMPLNFDDPGALAQSLRGAAVLYMTYWIRFPFGGAHFEKVVENIQALLRAAKEAEVRRILYISVSNPSLESPLPYFRGKALAEQAVIHSELSYAIIRPTLIFGREDILINNIAWLLRRFPVFAIPSSGDYRVQPVFVEDVAEISVRAAEQREDIIVDAVGPEVYTFAEFVRLIAQEVGSRTRLVHVPPALAL